MRGNALRPEQKSGLARTFETLLRQLAPELTITGEEVRVSESAGYKMDYMIDGVVAVEVDGGCHRANDKFCRSMNKHNYVTSKGWTFLRFGKHMVDDPYDFFDALKRVVKEKGGGDASHDR